MSYSTKTGAITRQQYLNILLRISNQVRNRVFDFPSYWSGFNATNSKHSFELITEETDDKVLIRKYLSFVAELGIPEDLIPGLVLPFYVKDGVFTTNIKDKNWKETISSLQTNAAYNVRFQVMIYQFDANDIQNKDLDLCTTLLTGISLSLVLVEPLK